MKASHEKVSKYSTPFHLMITRHTSQIHLRLGREFLKFEGQFSPSDDSGGNVGLSTSPP